ncbi:hypothetical protein H4R34_001143 [Dimargaris verticillata]|uniref:Uncharacterized protein n=1 Tax=Dimargaris verticillata TaxID=2761393 RepID=A0A9W8EAL6_9FUNG|nr:hypothetical protein H4R34_001143 [Dimargaris verticillata]
MPFLHGRVSDLTLADIKWPLNVEVENDPRLAEFQGDPTLVFIRPTIKSRYYHKPNRVHPHNIYKRAELLAIYDGRRERLYHTTYGNQSELGKSGHFAYIPPSSTHAGGAPPSSPAASFASEPGPRNFTNDRAPSLGPGRWWTQTSSTDKSDPFVPLSNINCVVPSQYTADYRLPSGHLNVLNPNTHDHLPPSLSFDHVNLSYLDLKIIEELAVEDRLETYTNYLWDYRRGLVADSFSMTPAPEAPSAGTNRWIATATGPSCTKLVIMSLDDYTALPYPTPSPLYSSPAVPFVSTFTKTQDWARAQLEFAGPIRQVVAQSNVYRRAGLQPPCYSSTLTIPDLIAVRTPSHVSVCQASQNSATGTDYTIAVRAAHRCPAEPLDAVFNPYYQNEVAIACADQRIQLWDLNRTASLLSPRPSERPSSEHGYQWLACDYGPHPRWYWVADGTKCSIIDMRVPEQKMFRELYRVPAYNSHYDYGWGATKARFGNRHFNDTFNRWNPPSHKSGISGPLESRLPPRIEYRVTAMTRCPVNEFQVFLATHQSLLAIDARYPKNPTLWTNHHNQRAPPRALSAWRCSDVSESYLRPPPPMSRAEGSVGSDETDRDSDEDSDDDSDHDELRRSRNRSGPTRVPLASRTAHQSVGRIFLANPLDGWVDSYEYSKLSFIPRSDGHENATIQVSATAKTDAGHAPEPPAVPGSTTVLGYLTRHPALRVDLVSAALSRLPEFARDWFINEREGRFRNQLPVPEFHKLTTSLRTLHRYYEKRASDKLAKNNREDASTSQPPAASAQSCSPFTSLTPESPPILAECDPSPLVGLQASVEPVHFPWAFTDLMNGLTPYRLHPAGRIQGMLDERNTYHFVHREITASHVRGAIPLMGLVIEPDWWLDQYAKHGLATKTNISDESSLSSDAPPPRTVRSKYPRFHVFQMVADGSIYHQLYGKQQSSTVVHQCQQCYCHYLPLASATHRPSIPRCCRYCRTTLAPLEATQALFNHDESALQIEVTPTAESVKQYNHRLNIPANRRVLENKWLLQTNEAFSRLAELGPETMAANTVDASYVSFLALYKYLVKMFQRCELLDKHPADSIQHWYFRWVQDIASEPQSQPHDEDDATQLANCESPASPNPSKSPAPTGQESLQSRIRHLVLQHPYPLTLKEVCEQIVDVPTTQIIKEFFELNLDPIRIMVSPWKLVGNIGLHVTGDALTCWQQIWRILADEVRTVECIARVGAVLTESPSLASHIDTTASTMLTRLSEMEKAIAAETTVRNRSDATALSGYPAMPPATQQGPASILQDPYVIKALDFMSSSLLAAAVVLIPPGASADLQLQLSLNAIKQEAGGELAADDPEIAKLADQLPGRDALVSRLRSEPPPPLASRAQLKKHGPGTKDPPPPENLRGIGYFNPSFISTKRVPITRGAAVLWERWEEGWQRPIVEQQKTKVKMTMASMARYFDLLVVPGTSNDLSSQVSAAQHPSLSRASRRPQWVSRTLQPDRLPDEEPGEPLSQTTISRIARQLPPPIQTPRYAFEVARARRAFEDVQQHERRAKASQTALRDKAVCSRGTTTKSKSASHASQRMLADIINRPETLAATGGRLAIPTVMSSAALQPSSAGSSDNDHTAESSDASTMQTSRKSKKRTKKKKKKKLEKGKEKSKRKSKKRAREDASDTSASEHSTRKKQRRESNTLPATPLPSCPTTRSNAIQTDAVVASPLAMMPPPATPTRTSHQSPGKPRSARSSRKRPRTEGF